MEKQEIYLSQARAISPSDGRYYSKTGELSEIFSEFGLMRYRLTAEIEYLIALNEIIDFLCSPTIVREMTPQETSFLRELYYNFNDNDFQAIKALEKTTNHDVKAVEYFIKAKLANTSLADIAKFIHYGLTSEDTNNLAYALMLRDGVSIIHQNYTEVIESIANIARQGKNVPLLSLTHGQAASPTTLGWAINVFIARMKNRLNKIEKLEILVKWNGATGGNNALHVAHPNIDWRSFSDLFIKNFESAPVDSLSLVLNEFTDQIEPHDTYAELFDAIKETNTVLISFAKNMWMYISREVFTQKAIEGEVGSSTMPQKINPIMFENAEGNLGIANALFEHFSAKLPDTRYQRDLSDSTVERYFGVAFSCTLIALKSLNAGMKRLSINHPHIYEELENRWEVISEAYQMILKREGVSEAYELLKDLTRGKKITKELLHEFVDKATEEYKLSTDVVKELKIITPHNYIGDRRTLTF